MRRLYSRNPVKPLLQYAMLLNFCVLSVGNSVQAQVSTSQSATPSIPSLTVPGQSASPTTPSVQSGQNNDAGRLLDRAIDYNKNLLDTVFLSLIATVTTIALAIFGLSYFEKILTREQEREILQGKLEKLLDAKLSNLQRNLWTWTDAQLNSIEIRLRWMEYKINILSAEQLENEGFFQYPTAIQERFRAIQTLQKLEHDSQGAAVITCLERELESVERLLSEFKSERSQLPANLVVQNVNILPNLTPDDIELGQEIIKLLEGQHRDKAEKINSHLKELSVFYKTNSRLSI